MLYVRAALVMVLLNGGLLAAKEAIWIEGEDYSSSTFNRQSWYQNTNISKDLLSPGVPGVSEGQWHCHYTNNYASGYVYATYRVNIVEGGDYSWWIRLNPFRNSNGGANYSYVYRRLGGGWSQQKAIDVSEARKDSIDLVDPGIDIRFIAWSFADTLHLTPGSYELQVRLDGNGGADKENHGGIDVMALTNFAWAPSGVVPPDPNASPPGPDDWFVLTAGPDQFSPESIIDVSNLIEKPAGLHGALHGDGKDFEFADGRKVKFWGMDASMAETTAAQQRQARFYAKYGINMVRQHPVESVLGTLQGVGTDRHFDPARLDKLDRWFATLKENGIYMTWSVFYHHVVTPQDGIDPELYDELPDSGSGKDCYGMATFIREYQDCQWEYLRTLMLHVNPYTGLAYKDDPELAIVEARNEDSVFFHNPLSDGFARGTSYPQHGRRLKEMWRQWVKDRYGDDQQLAAAWGAGMRTTTVYNGDGSVRSRPDSVDEPDMYIYAAWEMGSNGPTWNTDAERVRMGDFIRFLAEMQRADYQLYRQRLRSLGYQGVVVSTAWKAGGPAASAANLWTDDGVDAIDRHNYFGGGAGGHGITTGWVDNDTHLTKPGRGILSTGLWQVEDKPFIMTEWTQKPPNQWKAEITPLVAFYGMGLQGWDACYHFAGSRSYMGNGWPGMSSYVTETPHYIGQFPAVARAIYEGHFSEGQIISARRLSTDDAFSGRDSLQQSFGLVGYDENELLAHGNTPVEALAAGRVTLKVADGQEPSYRASLTKYWNDRLGTITSQTGQLFWDAANSLVLLRSDRTQGIVGFSDAGKLYDLPGASIGNVQTRFVSLLLTALDDRPIAESEHILITAMAQDKQYGSVYNEDGTELIEAGGPPLLLEPVRAQITIKGAPITSVRVVDVYGVPTDMQVERTGNSFAIDGRYATYYYEVKRGLDCGSANLDGLGGIDFRDFCVLVSAWQGLGSGGDVNGDEKVDWWDVMQWARFWLADCGDQ